MGTLGKAIYCELTSVAEVEAWLNFFTGQVFWLELEVADFLAVV